MNSSERIMATLAGKPLDRRAFIPVLSLYGARLTNCPLERYYTDPAAYAAGQLAVHQEFEPDMLLGPFALALIGAAFGSEMKFTASQPPNIRKPAITSLAEWDHLVLPDSERNPHLMYVRDAVRLLVAGLQGSAPVAACLPAPIDLPALVMGMEGWLDLVLFDKEGAQRVLEKANTFFVLLANSLFRDGASLIVLPCAYASPTVLMREPVESLMRPALRQALSQLDGPVILHHCGAALLEHMDILTGLPPAIGFALNFEEGLAQARRVIGPDAALLSGPNGTVLAGMNVGQVEDVCRELLQERDREHDRHFILVTLGADVPLNTPPENLHAMRRVLAEVGWNAA
jgi:uroporphyrinogen decarboxylase